MLTLEFFASQSEMTTNQDDKLPLPLKASNLENSALHWSFIDKILNKIDEVEDNESKLKPTDSSYEKAGFIYFFDSKSKESQQPTHIEIPLISDNEYLCCISRLFSSVSLNDSQPSNEATTNKESSKENPSQTNQAEQISNQKLANDITEEITNQEETNQDETNQEEENQEETNQEVTNEVNNEEETINVESVVESLNSTENKITDKLVETVLELESIVEVEDKESDDTIENILLDPAESATNSYEFEVESCEINGSYCVEFQNETNNE